MCLCLSSQKQLAKDNTNITYVCKLNERQVNPWTISQLEVEAFFPSVIDSANTDWALVQCEGMNRHLETTKPLRCPQSTQSQG